MIAGAGADLQQGIKQSQQRRHELLALIEEDPARRLKFKIPIAPCHHYVDYAPPQK